MTRRSYDNSMRAYWDERARRNAPWYVDTTLDYDAPDLDRFFADGAKTVSWALDRPFITLPGRRLAVEIGPGLGRMCKALGDRFDRVIGVDVSPEMVRRAHEVVRDDRIAFEVGDGTSLRPVQDASADLVLSFTVFQHIPSPKIVERYIIDAGRVLRPGGWIVFQWNNTPGARTWAVRRTLLSTLQRLGVMRERYERHAAEFLGSRIPKRHIRRALDRAGLDVVSTEGLDTLFAWVWAQKRI